MTAQATSKNGEKEKEDRKVVFAYEGDRIVIPEGMDLDEAASAIKRQSEEENVIVTISEHFAAFPFDGAVALMRVLQRRYGWTHLIPTHDFWGPKPPQMVGVEISFKERIQVPWGNMVVPKIDGTLTTGFTFENGMPCFKLSGNVKRKHERAVAALAKEIREQIVSDSIYRCKAIKINFRDSSGERIEFDSSLAPRFIDLENMGDCTPIFSESITNAIRVNIHNPIKFSSRCKSRGASLKKGVVLGGPFGTGKTLEAYEIANLCMKHGWTFLYLEDVRDLDLAIGFAKLYQPCVLFAEDVDKASAGPRTPEMDRLLNTIDGVESKGDQELMVVLTTNALEIINRAFLRPGRIDCVINVLPPDKHACLRIVKKYIAEGGCLMEGTDEDFMEAIKCLVGANAAFFRNTVEQAKLSAIESMENDDSVVTIRPNDLKAVAEGMVPHAKLINPEHGQKSLLEMEDTTTADPSSFAMDILMQKMAESFVGQISNPKTLSKIIMKSMTPRGGRGGSGPSNN